jgi:diguanylate cyclase (GGDEF)-like protein
MTRLLRSPGPRRGVVDDAIRRSLLAYTVRSSGKANVQAIGVICLIWAVQALTGAGLDHRLLVWVTVMTIFTTTYFRALRILARRLDDGGPLRGILLYLVCHLALASCCWGSLGFAILPGKTEVAASLVLGQAIMLIAGNLVFFSSATTFYVAYQIGLTSTSVSALIWGGYPALGAVVLFTSVCALTLRGELHRTVESAIVLARRNELLVEELHEQREAVEQTNRQLSEANSQLAHRATRDSLTGLANRDLLAENLERMVAEAVSDGRRPGVIYFDIDHFKPLNDTLGHAAGDSLLRQIATRVSSCVRPSDLVARVGGDEFVVAVHDGAEMAIAERIHQSFAEPFEFEEQLLPFSPSIGVASWLPGCSIEELVERADSALYEAKHGGRDQIRVWRPDPTPDEPGPAVSVAARSRRRPDIRA